MGGQVTAMIKFSDGSFISKSTYINSFCKYRKYADFHLEDKNFIENMFSPNDEILYYPDQYGFIFVDFKNKEMIEYEHYDCFDRINGFELFFDESLFTEINRSIKLGYITKIIIVETGIDDSSEEKIIDSSYDVLSIYDELNLREEKFKDYQDLKTFLYKDNALFNKAYPIFYYTDFKYLDISNKKFNLYDILKRITKSIPISKKDIVEWETFFSECDNVSDDY